MKVNENDAPVANASDLNRTGDPESETIVWSTPSRFVHETFDPGLMVNVAGLNAKFSMVMLLASVLIVGATEGEVGAF